MKCDISVVILTKNEQENIKRCLSSVKWAEEIIVVDDYSEDQTREIARKLGAKVYKRRLSDNFAAQRNFGLEKARNKWVLFVDGDEIVTPELAEEIKTKLSDSLNKILTSDDLLRKTSDVSFVGFKIKRVDYLWGRELKHGDARNVELIRFARKGAGRWKRSVHEYWDIGTGQIGKFDNPLLHYPHENVAQFLRQIRQYSLIHANVLQKEGEKPTLFQIIFYPIGKFIFNYFFKLGLLEGTAGFIHAAMMSFHSFLARSQLWLQQHKYPDIKKRRF